MGGSSGSSGSSSSSGTTTIRYADYIETMHKRLLNSSYNYRDSTIRANPYTGWTNVPIDVGFFGVGNELADHTYLYKTFYDAILNFDVDVIWNTLMESTVDSTYVNSMMTAESNLMEDEIQTNILPKYLTGMRDINAVVSSSFVIGKALIYSNKQKLLSKYSADLKFKLIGIVQDRWKTRLAWNSDTVKQHIEIIDSYFNAKNNLRRLNMEVAAKKALWAFDVMDYERANLGALTGATKQTSNTSSGGSTSKSASVAGGALAGAAVGASVGGVYGAAVGAVVGGLAGAFA